MSIYLRTGGGATPQISRMFVKQGPLSVVPVRRAYQMVGTSDTYPNGPAGGVVVRYDWRWLGDFTTPWRTPAVPTLTGYPEEAPLYHSTRLTLPNYQADDEKKVWQRVIQYAGLDGTHREWSTFTGITDQEVRPWEQWTWVKARAAFQNHLGRGPWSEWSDAVQTTDP